MLESLDREIQTLQTIFWSERDPDGLAFAPLADAFRRKGQVRQALDLLSEGTSRHPEYVTGHAIATQLYLENGMHAEAEFAARRVLELDPEHLVGLSALAAILADGGDSEEAAAVEAALLSTDPGSSEARRLAGSVAAVPRVETDPLPAEITELVPETMFVEGDEDSLFEDLAVRPVDDGESRPDEEELAQAMDSLGLSDGDEEGAGEPGDDVALEALDLGGLALDEPELGAMDLGALAPDGPDEFELEAVALDAVAPDEPELEVMDLGALAPDEPELEVMDLGALAPDEPELEVMDLGALAPDEPELEVMDLGALAPDEPELEVVDLSALAPDERELEVVDLGALAPDEPELEVVDLGALAPDEPELEVVDLGALAPDEPELEVVDLGALAPDEPELEVVDLGALAPDEPELEVMDLSALAPDEPELEVVDLGALAPDEPELEVVDLGALAPDPPKEPSDPTSARDSSVASEEPRRSSSPVYTRTLADLYVKQGFTDKAIEVLKQLQKRDPGDVEIASRIAQLESGTYEVGAPSSAPKATRPPGATGGMPVGGSFGGSTGHSEEDVEARARDLAESGEGADEVDTPFAWHDPREGRKKPVTDKDIGLYFDTLLEWENRAES